MRGQFLIGKNIILSSYCDEKKNMHTYPKSKYDLIFKTIAAGAWTTAKAQGQTEKSIRMPKRKLTITDQTMRIIHQIQTLFQPRNATKH